VGRLKEERLEKHKVTYDTHLAELARLREAALKKNSFSAAVNAETNRGKAGGLYIERKIIKHGKLEDMSELELENKMKQILDDYAPILNVTPEAKKLASKKPNKQPTQLKEKAPTSSEEPKLEDKELPPKTQSY
jgi:hypothetical protein